MSPMHVLDQDETVQAIIASKRAELVLAQTTQAHAAQLARAHADLAQTQRDNHRRACSLQQLAMSLRHDMAVLAQHAATLDVALDTAVADVGRATQANLHATHASLAARIMNHHNVQAADFASSITQRLERLQRRLEQCSAVLQAAHATTTTKASDQQRSSTDRVDIGQ